MKTIKSVTMDEVAFVRAAKGQIGYDVINPQGERLFESRFGSKELDVEARYVGTRLFELVPKTLLGELFLSVLLRSN